MSLPLSNKPQIIRSNDLEQQYLEGFISLFKSTIQQWFPNLSQKMNFMANILADTYYTLITLLYTRKRLGQQYTYTTIYREQDYLYEGVTVSKHRRLLLGIFQIMGRSAIWLILSKLIKIYKTNKISKKKTKAIQKNMEQQIQIMLNSIKTNSKYFLLMLFLLNINPFYTFSQTALQIKHAYTYKLKDNTQSDNIDYSIQGYMLLIIFIVKISKFIWNFYTSIKKNQQLQSTQPELFQDQSSQQIQTVKLCQICYSNIKNKTSTVCGHLYCWNCIIRYLQQKNQCPACRASCTPKQCVQLQNY